MIDTITTYEVLLTPELARHYLTKNDPRQRPLNYGHAGTMARDIIRGSWDSRLSEPIDFSTEGFMMNGQHRCMAVIKADKPIPAKVRNNCPPEWFEKYDRAKTRTVTDYYRGKEAKVVAGVATFAICIEDGATLWNAIKSRCVMVGNKGTENRSNIVPTVSERLDYIKEHESDLQFFATLGCRVYRVARYGSKHRFASALWYLWYLGADSSTIIDMVEDFCKPISTNQNVATIKAWYMKQITECIRNRISMPNDMLFALVLALYDGYVSDKPIKQPKKAITNAWDKYEAITTERRSTNE